MYRFFYLGSAFVSLLLISDIISSKIVTIGPFNPPAGIILYPATYILGDIILDAFGFKAMTRVIYAGLILQVVMSVSFSAAISMPGAPFWSNQTAYNNTLGQVPRIVAASLVAYFLGEMINGWAFAKIRTWTGGRFFAARALGSSVVGQSVDSATFISVAFAGTLPSGKMLSIFASSVLLKLSYEMVAYPVTALIAKRMRGNQEIQGKAET